MRKVVFIDEVHEHLHERLQDMGFTCELAYTQSRELLETTLSDATGIVVRSRFRMDASLLNFAKKLEFIARSGAGMENIDLDYCNDRGIALFNAPEGNRNAVAEHALGMLLALFNRLREGDQEIRLGKWDREGNRGYELEGKTIGLIGFGNNGGQFAKILSGFDVRILAYDKYKSGFGDEHVEEVDLDAIFKEADVLSFHVPQTPETLAWCDDEFLKNFEKPIYLINLSRGKIVKTEALLKALDSGNVLGACLDVLEFEKSSFESMFDEANMPVSFKKLLENKKVILSPHVGGWTHESYFKLSQVLADKIEVFYSR
jgi:D-3-phosphoglycerate dehydrogenase